MEPRHVLITGAGSGIGAAIARAFWRDGARVTLVGRRPEPLQAMARELGGAAAAPCDVTDEAAVMALVEGLTPVDVLINNAGAALTAPVAATTPAQMRAMLDVNLMGPFHAIRAVLPGMQARDAGRIITIASTASLKGYAYTGAYCAAKHAVLGLTRALAHELARTAVTANAICPGFTDTDLVERSINTIMAKTGRDRAQTLAELVKHNPQRRLIDPDEVAAAALWLASDAARSINGQAWAIAGGEIMGAG